MALILVVDDDDAVRGLVKKILVKEGHEVLEAPDGQVALRMWEERRPDLILTDIFMPGKEGIETIREIKRQRPSLPIIAMSGGIAGMNSEFTLKLAKGLGADITIPKPFSKAELVTVVNQVLSME
jgi:CheY-like chemotaxis protein